MNRKIYPMACLLLGMTLPSWAVPQATITATPELPPANLVQNSGFEEGFTGWILRPKAEQDNFTSQAVEGCTGKQCLTITGSPDSQRGASQRIKFDPPLQPGEPCYLRIRTRKQGCDSEAENPGGIALHATQVDKKSRYLSTFRLTAEDHEWTTHESVLTLKESDQPITSINFYLCYYNNEGTLSFDDILLQRGSCQLTLALNEEVRHLQVIHSVHGKLLKEKISGACEKQLTIPAYGSVDIIMTDANGKLTTQHYPEGVDANVPAADGVFPLGGISRHFLPHDDINLTFTPELRRYFDTSVKLASLSASYTTCTGVKNVPSLTERKPNWLELLLPLTHPYIITSLSA